jgi:hypothetical protein
MIAAPMPTTQKIPIFPSAQLTAPGRRVRFVARPGDRRAANQFHRNRRYFGLQHWCPCNGYPCGSRLRCARYPLKPPCLKVASPRVHQLNPRKYRLLAEIVNCQCGAGSCRANSGHSGSEAAATMQTFKPLVIEPRFASEPRNARARQHSTTLNARCSSLPGWRIGQRLKLLWRRFINIFRR